MEVDKKKVTAIVGSSSIIGDDPWSSNCWSGSGRELFLELKRQELLQQVIGFDLNKIEKYLIALRSISFSKSEWFEKFTLDPVYYGRLTSFLKNHHMEQINNADVLLQIGAIYNIPSITKPTKSRPVISYHDGNVAKMMTSPFFNQKLQKHARKAFQWEKHVYSELNHICTMSDYLRRSMIEDFGVDESRVSNIGVGVNFDIPPQSILPEQKKTFDLVFVGREFERKGGETILQAFNLLKDQYQQLTLHIIGPSEASLSKYDLDTNKVKCYGFLDRRNKRDVEIFQNVLANASIGLFPTLFDAFGIPVLEKFSYEIPCITTDILAMPELVKEGETGFLIKVNDHKSMAEAIEYYVENPEVCRTHGKNGRKLVVENYTWHNVVEKLDHVIQSV